MVKLVTGLETARLEAVAEGVVAIVAIVVATATETDPGKILIETGCCAPFCTQFKMMSSRCFLFFENAYV